MSGAGRRPAFAKFYSAAKIARNFEVLWYFWDRSDLSNPYAVDHRDAASNLLHRTYSVVVVADAN